MAHRKNWLSKEDIPNGTSVLTLVCQECSAEFFRDSSLNNWLYPKYCTSKCEKEVQRRKADAFKIEKSCKTCGVIYRCKPHKAETSKYCSLKCKWKGLARTGRVEVPCSTCGKLLIRRAKRLDQNSYCGYECMGKGRRLPFPNSNKWSAVREWFRFPGRMSKCEECGYDKIPEILVVHHKDRDRKNNALGNLAVLCPNCHAVEHLREIKSGWRGHESSDPNRVAFKLQRRKSKEEAVSQ